MIWRPVDIKEPPTATHASDVADPVLDQTPAELAGARSRVNYHVVAGGYYVQGEGLVVQTANNYLGGYSVFYGGGHDYPEIGSYTSAPARMHVWKLGDNP